MSETWIYHERQEALLCGQHALNNLLQMRAFSPESLAEIALQLDQMELNYMSAGNKNGVQSKDFIKHIAEGSGNVDASGNFSIEVLRSALMSKFNLTLANTLQESIRDIEITNFDGFICNRSSHWFAIRKINNQFWNLNSTSEKPEKISHFKLAAEMEALRSAGYSVFCVAEVGLVPSECKSEQEIENRGALEFWWKESDLMSGTGMKGYSNPWKNVGNGMRLDGKGTGNGNGNYSQANTINVEGLTEDEMMQMALAASMQDTSNSCAQQNTSSMVSLDDVELLPEPQNGAVDSVRIQFRLPGGKRLTRRFLKSDSVKVLVKFVREECPQNTSESLEMKAFFPPKDISPLLNETIESAKLSGESLQCRFS